MSLNMTTPGIWNSETMLYFDPNSASNWKAKDSLKYALFQITTLV